MSTRTARDGFYMNRYLILAWPGRVFAFVPGGHLVITGCPRGHSRRALSCKMNSEFDAFASSDPATKK